MFDTPMREIIPFFKKGGKVQIINKSVIKKKKMKQKQTQKQIVNIYNTKPAQRKRVYKKTVEKKDDQQQRMPVYYTQPNYSQYLPAPTITMPTKLPTMTADTKLPTLTGLTTGLKTTQETETNPEFDAEFNDYMNDKQIYEDEREKMKRKQKEIIDFFRTTSYKDEPLPSILENSNILPNFNYGRERLPPPNPTKPPIQEVKDPSAFSEFDDEEIKDQSVFSEYPEEKKEYEDDFQEHQPNPPSLSSDLSKGENTYPSIDQIKEMAKGYTKRTIKTKKAKEEILSMDIGYTSEQLDKLNASELNYLIPYIKSRIKDINRAEGQKARGRPRNKN